MFETNLNLNINNYNHESLTKAIKANESKPITLAAVVRASEFAGLY